MPGYGQIDHEYGLRLASTAPDDDGPLWMINLMRYRERAVYADGRESTLTGREADDEYTPLGPLAAIGAEIVFVADVEDQFIGEEPAWDRVAVVRYPTRASFVAMQQREDFRRAHEHKEAGMAETIVIGGLPLESPVLEPKVDWADVPHPPTDDDGAYTMIHVIRFHEAGGSVVTLDQVEADQAVAGSVAVRNGVRIDGWFSVEGTIVGDGRKWHQVRFHRFPSRRAFMAAATAIDPDPLRAHGVPSDTAIEDTYAIGVRARLDRLAESVAESA